MDGKKVGIAIIVTIIVTLLLQAGVLYYWQQSGTFDGTDGLSIKGDKGDQGIQGLQGNPGISIKGDKGDRGLTGVGATGSPGKDAPVNVPSEITLINMTRRCKTFSINLTVFDQDDENLIITVYYRSSEFSDWLVSDTFFGSSGNYTSKAISCSTELYWQVVVSDGSDLTFGSYYYSEES